MSIIDVLCLDKTGTITKNQLMVREIKPIQGFREADVLLYGKLASRKEDADPIDSAILGFSVPGEDEPDKYNVVSFTPFDPASKRTEATVQRDGGVSFKVTKGAPQVILSMTPDGDKIGKEVESTVTQMTATLITVYGVFFPALGWNLAIFVWGHALVSMLVIDYMKTTVIRLTHIR
jgi:H+-transporting ATPase